MPIQNIGALWIKEGKKGKFMSGSLEINGQKIDIMVFKNTYKTELKHPDYKIAQSVDEMTRPAVQEPKEESAQPPARGSIDPSAPITDQEIPFS